MSEGFAVDYDALDDMATVLEGLKDEFEGLEDSVGPYRDAAGHEDVSGALDTFATNWSDDRDEMIEIMGQASEYGHGAAEGYRCTDDEIAGQYSNSA